MKIEFNEMEMELIKEFMELEDVEFNEFSAKVMLISLIQDRIRYKKYSNKYKTNTKKNGKLPF